MEDSQIIALLFARAAGAIEALAQRYGKRLLATARSILPTPEDA